MIKNYSYYETEAGYKIDGKTNEDIVMAGGGHKPVSDFVLSTQLANYWSKSELPDYRNYGLGRSNEGATNYNLNNIAETSILGINNTTTGTPSGMEYGSVWTHRKSPNEFTQIAVDVITGQSYTRGLSGHMDIGWRKGWDNVNLPNPVDQSQLNNYLPLSGGTLTEGGRISAQGVITIQQVDTFNATGLFWETMANSDNMAGIGALTTGDTLHGVYMGWGSLPWQPQHSLSVSIDYFKYKGFNVWHEGNLNPVRIGGSGVSYNPIYLGWTGDQLQIQVDNSVIGNIWHTSNLDPVTRNTAQQITGKKEFVGATDNSYTGAGIMINGNGSTIYPTLAFHQPGLYAATISHRGQNEGFYFMNLNASGYEYVRTAGFIKDGSDNNYMLLGGGGHRSVGDFIFGSNGTGSIQAYSPELGLPDNSFKPKKSGFYRPNNDNDYGSLLLWVNHSQTSNGEYGSGLAFNYSGTEVWLTGNDSAGNKVVNKRIWHSENFNPASYVTQSSLIAQLGSYATLNGVQTFNNTITFNQSPVIPSATLGSHAVNLLQLNTKISALDSATGVGFFGGLATAPFVRHVINGDIPIATQDYADNLINSRVLSENNAVALGFVGATPDRPYVKHANGIDVPVATELWASNNFITLHSPQNVTGIKTFTVSPKVPSANNPDEAIPFGQSTEIAISTVRENFLTRTTNLPSNVTFDLSNYMSPMVTNIVIKGNPNGDLYIDGLDQGMTIKIMNTTPLNLIVRFDGGSLATGIGPKTWIEVHRDSEGDLIKNDTQNTIII